MRYLGGKAMIAKKLVAAINREVGASTPCWEPFMGGGNMTEHLAKTRSGVASDVFAPIMSLWVAAKGGWNPPSSLSLEEWNRGARVPDSDPLKAFAGFGCSYGGMWFSSYAGDVNHISTRWRPESRKKYNAYFIRRARGTRVAIRRVIQSARAWKFEHASFFDREPRPEKFFIYADPPYAKTLHYSMGEFQHARFWKRCQEWARFVPVLVSEYACPVDHHIRFECVRSRQITGTSLTSSKAPTERLFRVLPAYRIRTQRAR